jgi:hypothetical protein
MAARNAGLTARLAAMMLGAAIALAAPAAWAIDNIEWSSGSPGGSWFTIVTGLSNIVMEKNPDIKIRIVPGGGRDNPSKVEGGLSQLGMGIDFLANAALQGSDPYAKPHLKLRSLGGTWAPAEFHVLVPTTEKRPLEEILKDPKIRVGTTPRATSEELTLRRALSFYGNSPEKIREAGGNYVTAQYTELISAFQDGQIDFAWAAGSGQTGVALEIESGRRPAKLIAFPDALMAHLVEKFGYGRGVIKANTYKSIQLEGKEVPVAVMEAVVLASSDVSPDLAYRITKTLIENRGRFGSIYGGLAGYDPAVAWKDQPVPLHPGAEKAYRELGFMK